MQNRCIILGCGISAGVPSMSVHHPGGEWGTCDPNEPKNRRTRSSVYIEYEGLRLLVDTSPDLRQQYLDHKLGVLDAVLITHKHNDHIGGIEALRDLYFSNDKQQFDIYASSETFLELKKRAGYLFTGVEGYAIYPPIFKMHEIGSDFSIQGHKIQVEAYAHGNTTTFGFRFGKLAYFTDFKSLESFQLERLQGIDTWILDAAALVERPTHAHLETALAYIEIVKPRRAILTHMGRRMDYQSLCRQLPEHIRPAYDGMELFF